MATEVILPKLGFSMSEGTISEWLMESGEVVSEGQAILLLEADKASHEVEAPASGTLRIIVEEGGPHACGTVIGMIE